MNRKIESQSTFSTSEVSGPAPLGCSEKGQGSAGRYLSPYLFIEILKRHLNSGEDTLYREGKLPNGWWRRINCR